MLDSLVDLITAGPVAYLVALGLVTLDAIVPVFPSETALITCGILAARGELFLPLVVLAGAAGALLGDTILYLAGTRASAPIRRRLFDRERARRRLEWMQGQLRDRTWLLIVADFIPGGRTAAMFAAGATELPMRRFYAFAAPGAVLWSAVYGLLGFAGGRVFRDAFWPPLLVAFAVAGLLALAFELYERRTARL